MGGGGDRGERDGGDFADFQGGRNGMPDMAQMGMNPFANNMNGFPAQNTADTGTQAGTNPTETTTARMRNVATETDSRTVLNSSNLFGLITLAISTLSIIAGCVSAKLYRRKRYRTKQTQIRNADKLKNLSFRVSARNLALKFLYLKKTEKKQITSMFYVTGEDACDEVRYSLSSYTPC
eukprot:TRINITY_DN14286_c0_g1_i1.p1 TRINITY_DN14286_c0_g1~~TRINITY_DN14286_c0_g1_i1.p1  ORF type:complete len:179 (+),score=6.96 TRINITY_DN14286_c0_g1_i1:3-539(+)